MYHALVAKEMITFCHKINIFKSLYCMHKLPTTRAHYLSNAMHGMPNQIKLQHGYK